MPAIRTVTFSPVLTSDTFELQRQKINSLGVDVASLDTAVQTLPSVKAYVQFKSFIDASTGSAFPTLASTGNCQIISAFNVDPATLGSAVGVRRENAGLYTVYFINPLPDALYIVSGSGVSTAPSSGLLAVSEYWGNGGSLTDPVAGLVKTTSKVRIVAVQTDDGGLNTNNGDGVITVAIIR